MMDLFEREQQIYDSAKNHLNETQSGSDYIKQADDALYMSKQNGRNQYTFMSF